MKTKKTFLKMGMFGLVMGYLSLSFTSAAKLYNINLGSLIENIYDEKYITENMMYVHFADNGNDFGGILYFSNVGEENACEEATSDCGEPEFQVRTEVYSGYECRKQVKGLYYNAQRGERLWPLDKDTASGLNISFTGGIYTNCRELGYFEAIKSCSDEGYRNGKSYEECIDDKNSNFKADGFGYFGSVTHGYSGQTMTLVMGVNYTGNTEFISIESGSILAPTFARLDNKYPVGFIYDYNGGLGLAGCRFTNLHDNDNSMKDLFREYSDKNLGTDTYGKGLLNVFAYDYASGTVVYTGRYGSEFINCENISEANTLLKIIIEGVVGLGNKSTKGEEKKTIYGTRGNSTDTKMQQFATKNINNNTMMNYIKKKAELLCRGKWTGNVCNGNEAIDSDIICFNGDGNPECDIRGHTFIAKKDNVIIKVDNETDIKNDKNYDIYVLSGDLIINEFVGSNAYKFVFDRNGYYMGTGLNDFSGEAKNYDYNGSKGVAVASSLKGNFIVNGKIKGPAEEPNNENLLNKYFIYGKVVSKDTIDDLEDTFSRRCNHGVGSDGYPCPRFSAENTANDYQNASLIIIDQNFRSPMLNS